MSVQDKATLKSYFETGDKPTQANFEDLIDSLGHVSDGLANGGNSFGADASIGTNDNYNLIIRTNNATRWTVREDGRIQKTGTTSALTHDISADTIGATGYSGSKITFGGSVTLQANNNVILTLNNGNLQFNSSSNFVIEQISKSGTNVTGNDAYIKSQRGTGNTTPTSIIFQTPTAGSSGSTAQALADRLVILYNASNSASEMRLVHTDTNFSYLQTTTNGGLILSTSHASADIRLRPNGSLYLGDISTDNIYIGRTDYAGIVNLRSRISTYHSSNLDNGTIEFFRIGGTFNPDSGDAAASILSLAPIYNQTGTSSGTVRGIYYNPTLTSVLGSHYAFEATSGLVKIGDTTQSTSSTTGALVVAGGAGIAKDLNIAGAIKSTGAFLNFTVGSGYIRNTVHGQQLYLLSWGQSTPTKGVVIGSENWVANSSSTSTLVTLTGTFMTTSGNGNFDMLSMGAVVLDQSGTAGTDTILNGLNINPTINSVRGTLYGIRSQIADAPTGGGTAWNIYADGSASNYLAGKLGIGTNSLSAKLHIQESTPGNELIRLESFDNNDVPTLKIYQNRVLTTDATQTTLHTFSVPGGATVKIKANVVARRTGGTSGTGGDSASYVIEATYKNISGTLTLVGSKTVTANEDQSGWDADFSTSSNNILLQVTGAANNNILWHLSKAEVCEASLLI